MTPCRVGMKWCFKTSLGLLEKFVVPYKKFRFWISLQKLDLRQLFSVSWFRTNFFSKLIRFEPHIYSLSINCYLSNVQKLPLGGKFKIWTFHMEQQNLPEVRRLVFKMRFHSYSNLHLKILLCWLMSEIHLEHMMGKRLISET